MTDPLFDDQFAPALPYYDPSIDGPTSGWSGSDASHDRALADDASGATKRRQQRVLAGLASHRTSGLTVVEIRDWPDFHHGKASGALSGLHKKGVIACLVERRGDGRGAHIYVLPEFVDGRPTRDYTPNGSNR